MLQPRGHLAAPAPVAEMERKIHWRAAPMFVFLGIMVSLAALVVVSAVLPPPRISGLPDDPDVRAAAGLVRGRLRVDAGGLRFHAALLGDGGTGHSFGAADEAAVGRAEALLRRAAPRLGRDPRIPALFACLDLVRRDQASAERGYRRALDPGGRYGEARLALGVTLALRAEREADPLRQRALLLQAIAQFAAVETGDPADEAALFNRALLLERVGRREEARRLAESYLARDGGSAWAERLRMAVGTAVAAPAPR
jgi:tetratricopeptide (TPR) repeat protein